MSSSGGDVRVGLLSGKQAEIPFAPSDTLRSLAPAILSRLGLKPMVVFHPTPIRFLRGSEQLHPDQLVTALDLQPEEEITAIAGTAKEVYAMLFRVRLSFLVIDLRARWTLSDAYTFSIELIGAETGDEVDREIHGTWSIELKDDGPQLEALVLRPFGTQRGDPILYKGDIVNAAMSLLALGPQPVGLPASWFRHPGSLCPNAGDVAVVRLLDPDATRRAHMRALREEFLRMSRNHAG